MGPSLPLAAGKPSPEGGLQEGGAPSTTGGKGISSGLELSRALCQMGLFMKGLSCPLCSSLPFFFLRTEAWRLFIREGNNKKNESGLARGKISLQKILTQWQDPLPCLSPSLLTRLQGRPRPGEERQGGA